MSRCVETDSAGRQCENRDSCYLNFRPHRVGRETWPSSSQYCFHPIEGDGLCRRDNGHRGEHRPAGWLAASNWVDQHSLFTTEMQRGLIIGDGRNPQQAMAAAVTAAYEHVKPQQPIIILFPVPADFSFDTYARAMWLGALCLVLAEIGRMTAECQRSGKSRFSWMEVD